MLKWLQIILFILMFSSIMLIKLKSSVWYSTPTQKSGFLSKHRPCTIHVETVTIYLFILMFSFNVYQIKKVAFATLLILGREQTRFTQLKRHTRFDDFVMLAWGQGSMFDIAAVSLPVQ